MARLLKAALGICILAAVPCACGAALRAGVAKIDIMPPAGLPMWGYESRKSVATGTVGPLYARVLALEAGGERLALVALDLGRCFGPASLAQIRERAKRTSGISNVLVVASHTHSGPVILDEYTDGTPSWESSAVEKIGTAIAQAQARALQRTIAKIPACGYTCKRMLDSTEPKRAADVAIIGGGLIGCSIALRLAQAKLKVIVFDRGEPGGEASAAAAGMLAPQGETVEPDGFFEFCAASRDLYPSFVDEVESLSGQTVGYRREGTLLVSTDAQQTRQLEEIYRGQTRHGLPLERLSPEAVHSRVPCLSDQTQAGLFIPRDHWVDNERLAQAVVEACRRLGVTFCPRVEVTRIAARNGRAESVEARSGTDGTSSVYSAGQFVLAAGCWSKKLMEPLGLSLPIEPCRGQMLEFESEAEWPIVVRAGHHYLVPRSSRRILAGTTAEYAGFDKTVTGAGLHSILEGVSRITPLLNNLRFLRAWAGLRPDTADHLPILGYSPLENLVFATGHFRNGILLAPLTAQLIAELLLTDSTSRSIEPYAPGRFTR